MPATVMAKRPKKIKLTGALKQINLNAAGIDIGSAEHYITVPDHKPIKVGTLTAILRDLAAANDMSRDELLRTLKL